MASERSGDDVDMSARSEAMESSRDEARSLYSSLTEYYPAELGKGLSTRERDRKGLHDVTLTYSEAEYETLAWAVDALRKSAGILPERGGSFVDLGSGMGKAAFACALLHDFDEVVGVELLDDLHEVAAEILDKFDRDVRPTLPPLKRTCSIKFIRGDFRSHDVADATFLLINCTCFDEALMRTVAAMADRCTAGSVAVTFTRRLPTARWRVVLSEVRPTSWGSVTVFLHEKVL